MAGKIKLSNREIANKMAVLESIVAFQEYKIYDPSADFCSSDVISVQKEASKMLQHIGLMGYLPVISFSTVKEGTAGHIELDRKDKSNIFINISSEYKGCNPAVLCIMAHEICHKLLDATGFTGESIEENEVFTDLAAVYSGFGKLILNGNHVEWNSKSFNIGYLDNSNYAYSYLLMAITHSISPEVFNRGLSDVTIVALSKIQIFPVLPASARLFDDIIIKRKKEYGDLLRDIFLVNDGLQEIKTTIKNKLTKLDLAIGVISQDFYLKPLSAYAILLEPDMKEKASVLQNVRGAITTKSDVRQTNCAFCPFCGKELALSSIKDNLEFISIKCPSCNNRFILSMSVPRNNQTEPSRQKKNSFLSNNKELFILFTLLLIVALLTIITFLCYR